MIIAEKLVLLSLEPKSGNHYSELQGKYFKRAIAAAFLIDLCLSDRLVYGQHQLYLPKKIPISNRILEEQLEVLEALNFPLSCKTAIDVLSSHAGKQVKRMKNGLVQRDILHRMRKNLLFYRFPLRSAQVRNTILDEIQATESNKANGLGNIALLGLLELSDIRLLELDASKNRLYPSGAINYSGPRTPSNASEMIRDILLILSD